MLERYVNTLYFLKMKQIIGVLTGAKRLNPVFKQRTVITIMQRTISPELAEEMQARELARSGMGRLIRTKAGLSLRQVASEVGATASAVLYWETGKFLPKSESGRRWGVLMRHLLERES